MNSTEFEEQLNEDAETAVNQLLDCMADNLGEGGDEDFVDLVIQDFKDGFKLTSEEEECLEDNINYFADNITIYYSTVNSIFSDCYPYSQEIQDQDDVYGFEYDTNLTFGENVDKIQALAVYSYYRDKLREIVDSIIDDEQRFFGMFAKFVTSMDYSNKDKAKVIALRNAFIGSPKEEMRDIEERIDDDSKE